MKVLLNVTLRELEDKINRQVLVDENIELTQLCEYVIVSMDGKKIPIYDLELESTCYFPYKIEETNYDKNMIGIKLRDLNLQKERLFSINYGVNVFYCFDITIDNFIEVDNSNNNIDFEVLSGKGYGIVDGKTCSELWYILSKSAKDDSYYLKSEREYLQKVFDKDVVNNKVNTYKEEKKDMLLPKTYIFNVSLDGFNKEIKRKISVNNNILINTFCEKVIKSMNGDLSHLYDIKMNKEYLQEEFGQFELFYLSLKEKSKIKIIYDFGDDWQFNLTLSKIIDGYNNVDFEVLSGKGHGIVDDCGGNWGLSDLINDKNNYLGYDINDFDINKLNDKLKRI